MSSLIIIDVTQLLFLTKIQYYFEVTQHKLWQTTINIDVEVTKKVYKKPKSLDFIILPQCINIRNVF